MIPPFKTVHGFSLSCWRQGWEGEEAVKHRIRSLASTNFGSKRGRKSIRSCKKEILYTSFLVAIIALVLHLSFFVRSMVNARQVTEQKRLQKRRERAKLARHPRKWRNYLRKDRDRQRRARANFQIQVEAKLKEAKKKCDACKKKIPKQAWPADALKNQKKRGSRIVCAICKQMGMTAYDLELCSCQMCQGLFGMKRFNYYALRNYKYGVNKRLVYTHCEAKTKR